MKWAEFLILLSDLTPQDIPDGYAIVPMPARGYPDYTVWMFNKGEIEKLKRKGVL